MKRCIGDVLNGTIGFFEMCKDRSREFVEKGQQNKGPFARVVHEVFSNESEISSGTIKSWIGRGLHAMNIATLEDLEALRQEWERRSHSPGSSENRTSG